MLEEKQSAKRPARRSGPALALAGAFAALTTISLHAGASDPTRPVIKVLAVRPEKLEVRVGEPVRVSFDLEAPARWHFYPAAKLPLLGKQTVFEFRGAELAGAIVEPRPRYQRDGVLESDFHEGRVTIMVPIRLAPGVAPGPLELNGRIVYQLCDWSLCLNGEAAFQFPLKVVGGVPAPAPATR